MCFFSLFAPFFFFTHLIADWWILGWRWKDSGQRRKSRNRSRRLSVFLAQIAQIGKYTHNVKDDKTRTVTLTQMTADIKRCWNDSVELLFRSFFSLIRVPGWPAVEQIEGLRLRHPVAISVHKRKEGWKKNDRSGCSITGESEEPADSSRRAGESLTKSWHWNWDWDWDHLLAAFAGP